VSLERIIKINSLICLSYILLYLLSIYLWDLDILYGNLLFLPHSVRLIGALIFGWVTFPGLLIGHVFCEVYFNESLSLLLAIYGACIVYLSIDILKYFKVFDFKNFNNVSFGHIIFIVFLASFFNAIGSFVILDYYNQIDSFNFIFSYFIGDFLGGFVGLYLFLKFFYKFFE